MKKNEAAQKRRARAKAARFFTALVVISVIVCVILFANKNQVHAVEGGDSASLSKYYKTITIQPGDTLWDIAAEYKMENRSTKDYVNELMQMNGLHNDNITAGMNLVIVYYN